MSGQVELIIDEIEAIASQLSGYISAAAQTRATTFANATLPASAFNGVPPGMAFHAQQQAAHQVFVETINGVVADLEQFGETLAANAASHRAVDESNASTFASMEAQQDADQQAAAAAMSDVNAQYTGETEDVYQAQQAYDEERSGNEALAVDDEVALDGGAAPADDGAGLVEAPQEPPAADPVNPSTDSDGSAF